MTATTATAFELDRLCQILDLEGDRAAAAVLEGESRCYRGKLDRARLWRDSITIGRSPQGPPDWPLPSKDRLRQLWSELTEPATSATATDSPGGSWSEPNLHVLDPTVSDAFRHLRDEPSNRDRSGQRDEDPEGM